MLKIKSWVAALGLSAIAATSMAAELTGAGATFPSLFMPNGPKPTKLRLVTA
jgi:hypothetical protein